MNELIVGLIGLVSTAVSGWVSWFFTRKKYNSEVDSNYIDNLTNGLKAYDTIIEHNKAEIEFLLKENEELRKEIAELRKQVLTLTMNICMDLTCTRRTREEDFKEAVNGKIKDRFSETKNPCKGGRKSVKAE